jgi:hypothetical protein
VFSHKWGGSGGPAVGRDFSTALVQVGVRAHHHGVFAADVLAHLEVYAKAVHRKALQLHPEADWVAPMAPGHLA